MGEFLDFMGRHPILFMAAAALLAMLIVSEVLRRVRNVSTVNPNQAMRLINDEGAMVLDIRDIGEYRQGHIPAARHVAAEAIKNGSGELDKYKGKPIVVYARTAGQSAAACAQLKKHGFTSVHNLDGGITAWREASLPVRKK